MNSDNRLIVVLFFVIAGFPLNAQNSEADELTRIKEITLRNSESESSLFAMIDDGIEQAGKLSPDKARSLRAELHLLHAHILLQKNRIAEADKELSLAEEQVGNTTENANSMALLVEIRTSMFATRGLGFIFANAGAIETLLKKAIEKEPNNIRVVILAANSELYKPFGNLDSSIALFDRALKLPGITSPQKFSTLLGIAEAWNKKGKTDQRKAFLLEAKEIYPNNPILIKVLKDAGLPE